MNRCTWPKNDLAVKYHDEEWGVPCHDDTKLFEFIVLEGAQAGLSWDTILRKREAYREAFEGFDVEKVAKFTDRHIAQLMQNEGIIRNRLKVNSAVKNANAFIAVQREFGSFDKYIWSFVGGKPIVNAWTAGDQIPPKTAVSDKVSEDMRKRGFSFVGSTIIYAHMQATGMINDHLVSCFRHKELSSQR